MRRYERGWREKMIVLNVTYKCEKDKGERFLEAIGEEGLDEACRAEEGNIKYDYYYPVSETDEILLVEKWRDADALAKHMEEPHFKRLGQIKEGFGIETVIEKYISE